MSSTELLHNFSLPPHPLSNSSYKSLPDLPPGTLHVRTPRALRPTVCLHRSHRKPQTAQAAFPGPGRSDHGLELRWKTGGAVLTLKLDKLFASQSLSFLCRQISITIPAPQQRHGELRIVCKVHATFHIKCLLCVDGFSPTFPSAVSQSRAVLLISKVH